MFSFMFVFMFANICFEKNPLICIFYKGAKLSLATEMWIGISDIDVEGTFTYLSDATKVEFSCATAGTEPSTTAGNYFH